MKYIIISFKSRNNVFAFAKFLKEKGVSCKVINTPKSVSISCGLSIKTELKNLNIVKSLLSNIKINGFLGVYLIYNSGIQEQTQRLI